MIKDQIDYNLKILFVGINPHPGSYRRHVPFSNNKMFWYLLKAAGLITETKDFLKDDLKLQTLYYHQIITKYGFGFTNIVDRPSRVASEIKKSECFAGKTRLQKYIITYTPTVVCFVGKITYQLFSNLKNIPYGWQLNIGASKIYVMHAPHRGFAHIRITELQEVYNKSNNRIFRPNACVYFFLSLP